MNRVRFHFIICPNYYGIRGVCGRRQSRRNHREAMAQANHGYEKEYKSYDSDE